jgi:LuxR family maltose regulon positive regulatory protein
MVNGALLASAVKMMRRTSMMSALPYLVTKVSVPPVRATVIPRMPLISRLETRVPLLLLAAGAGFGKTTLLSAWARETSCQVAWLTLDEQDNDPLRFWGYVLLALRRGIPALGEAAFAGLHEIPVLPLSTVLSLLLNDIALLSEEVTLVLDDYHLIDEPAIHQSLSFILAHAPACLHLALATRVEPELPLSRLRVRGHIVEIREADLRLNLNETACFLTQTMDLHLQEADILQLSQRSEGWIAGLQLVALFLRTHANPSAWVSQFQGSHRILLDYVQEDILEREPLSIQRFLLKTSVLKRMTATLCQQLCGEQTSQEILEALVRANLFVAPLDDERHWYRSHPLFREALFARLQANEPESVPLLHQRASAWFAEQHLFPEAIAHALAARDFPMASDLIERVVVPQSWHNEYHTLRSWLSDLPKALLHARPALAFLFAQAMILTSSSEPLTWQAVEEPLRWAERGYREAEDMVEVGAVLAVRAVIASFQGGFPQAFARAHKALSFLPSQDQQWRGLCLCVLGMEAILAGQRTVAVPLLQQALVLSHASGLLPAGQFATLMLGEECLAAGDFGQAASFFQQVLCISSEPADLVRNLLTNKRGDRRTHFERLAWYALAYLADIRNDLSEASHALQESLAEGQCALIHLLTPGLLLQVRLLYAQGRSEQARTLLVTLTTAASQAFVQREIQFCRAWLAFAQGEVAVTAQWAADLAETNAPIALARQEEEALLQARLWIAECQPERALGLLEPMLREARMYGRTYQELQILVQQTLAQAACGAQIESRKNLYQALTIARQQGAVRLFLEEGQPMKRLLNALLPDLQGDPLAAFVHTFLDAFTRSPVSSESDSHARLPLLTPQERRVLQLLAEGLSNQDIAQRLVISLATARKHVSNILSKLGVQSRTQAVARARADTLL